MALVMILMALWAALGVWILLRAKLPRVELVFCLTALAAAAILRLLCMGHETLDYQDFLAPWVDFFRQNGGFLAIKKPVGNYNVPYLYFLALISYLPVRDLYLIKLFSIFFDLLLAYAGLRLARQVFGTDRSAALAFSLLLVLPTVLLNGAYWGQCDSLYGALTLLALADALEGYPAESVVWLGLAFAFKLQTVFLIPLWCILWYSGRVKFKHLLLFPAANAVVILPALLLGKPLGDILGVYLGQAGQYSSYLTLNAPSVYSLIPYGTTVDTALWSKVGIAAAFLALGALLLWLFFHRSDLTDGQILTAGALMAVFIPLLLPHMHDRYFFLADALSVVWAVGALDRAILPVMVQIASFGGYHAYLVLRYAFPMAWGALLLIGAAAILLVHLWCSFHAEAVSALPADRPQKHRRRK